MRDETTHQEINTHKKQTFQDLSPESDHYPSLCDFDTTTVCVVVVVFVAGVSTTWKLCKPSKRILYHKQEREREKERRRRREGERERVSVCACVFPARIFCIFSLDCSCCILFYP